MPTVRSKDAYSDARSVYSNMSGLTDVSLDPLVKEKAILIMDSH